MLNEYGERLDRNGYAPSIIPGHGGHCCWRCKRNGFLDPLNRHEVFGGAYREKSKRLGLWVYLCHHQCHQGPDGVHQNAVAAHRLRVAAQEAAMETYGWTTEDFREEFGKNFKEDI